MMKSRNILLDIFQEKMDLAESENWLDNVISSPPTEFVVENEIQIQKLTGLDQYEYTAYCHGASLDDLVKWRYNGWPGICLLCSQEINYKVFGWTIKEINALTFLVHIDC